MTELWASVFKDYVTDQSTSTVFGMLVHEPPGVQPKQIIKLNFITVITEEQRNYHFPPADGWLCEIMLRYKRNDDVKLIPCFGYLDNIKMERLTEAHYNNQRQLAALTQSMKPEQKKALKHFARLEIWTKKIPQGALTDKPLIIKPISRIKPCMRIFRALEEVGSNHLFAKLLNPNRSTFFVRSGTEACQFPDGLINLNGDQRKIMSACASMCTTNLSTPQAAIIQGPPGTGKSTTIAAMVLQIIFRWRKNNPAPVANQGGFLPLPRILITAPSNAAVDEIVRKLLVCRQKLAPKDRFNMMRIGKLKSIHPDVQNISLDKLKEVNLKSNNGSSIQSLNLDITAISKRINELTKKLEDKNLPDDELQHYTRQLRDELQKKDQAKAAKSQQIDYHPSSRQVQQAVDDLFHNADIIASTINSSMNGPMENFFVRNARKMSICIMDEASQCVEPEALIPLKLGFSKLVMVGDPAQLPATVQSMQTKKENYHISLFSRIFKHFEHEPDSPIQQLTVQYRMHSEISTWPNRRFYGGKLRMGDQNRKFSLANYRVLSLEDSYEEVQGGSTWNYEEAKVVAGLTRYLRDYLAANNERKSIGIITFYSRQKSEIMKSLRNMNIPFGDKSEDLITVRTVDGFQGSECDIIVSTAENLKSFKTPRQLLLFCFSDYLVCPLKPQN